LADQGFVVFAMRPPEWSLGLERKANPLGLTHSSFIMAQHSRLLEWLASLPFVDPARVGFYGLSHGPATAFAVPAILDGYSLAVCSIRSASPAEDDAGSGVPPPSGEGSGFPGFGMEARFGLAELAALIAPRPVMLDCAQAGTASGEELAAACAKARGFYERLGIGTRAVIVPPGSGSDTNATDGLRFLQEHLGRPPVK
jgi:hypothetical protein